MTLKEFFSFSWLRNILTREGSKRIGSSGQGTEEFELTESMWGYMAEVDEEIVSEEEVPDLGEAMYRSLYERGKSLGNKLFFEVTLSVKNFEEFTAPSGRRAPMTGKVTCKKLFGENCPISNGEYGLYWVDPTTGGRRISYRFNFKDEKGIEYGFSGIKKIVHEPGEFDVLEDQTTLFAVVRRLGDAQKPIVVAGIIHYHVEDFPAMLASIRTPSDNGLPNRIRTTIAFFSFVSKEISEYFDVMKPTYRAEYRNLVISGRVLEDGKKKQLFLFSGVHDKGFPWGDKIGFADVGLLIGDNNGWRRFAISAHALPNLALRLSEGTCAFEGDIFEILSGQQVAFSEMQEGNPPRHLKPTPIAIRLKFKPKTVYEKNIPFESNFDALKNHHAEDWKEIEKSEAARELEKWRDIHKALGYTSEVIRVTDIQGSVEIGESRLEFKREAFLGEAEIGTITGVKKPTLYYNYFCALEPGADLFRVHVRSGVLRQLSQNRPSTKALNIMGNLVGQFVVNHLKVKGEQVEELEWDECKPLVVPTEELLEINNDHYPTGVFQRRVVRLPGMADSSALALEEDMSVLDLRARQTDRKATVAAIKEPDRFNALDHALEATGFFD
jgi:hypothetical protein